MKKPVEMENGILVIDDTHEQVQVFTGALRKMPGSYNFRTADNILQAVKIIRRHSLNFSL